MRLMYIFLIIVYLFSYPELKAPGELIGYAASVVRLSSLHTNEFFFSETTGPM